MNPREHLQAGAHVTYTQRHDWGVGRIIRVTADRLHVRFEELDPCFEGEFGPGELQAVIPSEAHA